MAVANPSPAPAGSWSVIGQQEQVEFDQQGKMQNGVKISFQTGQGHSGTVFVPQAQYNPERVKELVAAKAQLMDQVGALSSSG